MSKNRALSLINAKTIGRNALEKFTRNLDSGRIKDGVKGLTQSKVKPATKTNKNKRKNRAENKETSLQKQPAPNSRRVLYQEDLGTNNLKYYRLKAGLTVQELATCVGIRELTLFTWENEAAKWSELGGGPSLNEIDKIAHVLGVSPKQIQGYPGANSDDAADREYQFALGSKKQKLTEIDALLRSGLDRKKLRAAIIEACIRRGYTRQAAIRVANRHTRSDAPSNRPLYKPIREEQKQRTDPDTQYTPAQIDQLLGNWIRRTTQVGTRPQQAAFRRMVLEAYGCICAVTGSNEENVLEAAHIKAYSGPLSDRISNGICLRADIHKLYDAGLISFTTDFRVHVSNRVADERYRIYHGQLLQLPLRRSDWPYLTQSKNSSLQCGVGASGQPPT